MFVNCIMLPSGRVNCQLSAVDLTRLPRVLYTQHGHVDAGSNLLRILRPGEVRGANRAAVLRLLRQHERLSRVELARQTGLSEGSVSRITAELITSGLVAEHGEENSTGGRPATRLSLTQSRLAMGVEIHSWEVQFSIATMRGQLLESRSFRAPGSPETTLALIAREFKRFQAQYGRRRLQGIGVSARGTVDSRSGVVELGNDPKWVRVPVRDRLQKLSKTPVFVENNVRLGALAENHFGRFPSDGSGCFVFVKVDEGVGMGLVFDGRLYHGSRMAAGEFGQMVIADEGGDERQDRPGCLERLACDQALCERYFRLSGRGRIHRTGNTTAAVGRICHQAMAGDKAAGSALRTTARYLGIGIANVVWGLDADSVVVDCSYREAWPIVAEVILQQFPVYGELVNFRGLQLRPSLLEGKAAMIGAATLPFLNVFATGEHDAETRAVALR